ncbi:MAG: tetratricopeptide repeat protein [Myxococcota bacterium]
MTDDGSSLYANALAAHDAGDLDTAEALYRQLLPLIPDDPEIPYRLAVLLWQTDRLEEALQVSAHLPAAAVTDALLGNIHFSAGRAHDAIIAWARALAADPDQPRLWSQLGLAHDARGETDAALAAHQRAIQAAPDQGAFWYNLALTQQRGGDLAAAEASYRRALETLPDDPEVLNNLGNILQGRGDHGAAVGLYERALQHGPPSVELLYNLGACRRMLKNFTGAVSVLRHATERAPDHDSAWIQLGMALGSMGKPDEAVAAFRKALYANPRSLMGWINLGHTFKAMGREGDALVAYQTASRHTPEDGSDYLNAAVAFHNRGQRREAMEYYQKALELNPSDDAARHLLNALTGATPDTAPGQYISELFDDYAHRYDAHLEGELAYRLPVALRQLVDAHAPAQTFDRVLDLGCGTGLMAVAFQDRVTSFIGVDLSEKMLTQARARGLYDEVVQDDVVRFLQQRKEDFDLILAADVLVYLGDLAPLMSAAAARLRPGGRLVISTEQTDDDRFLLRESGRFAHSRAYVKRLAEAAGLHVETQRSTRIRKDHRRWIEGDVHLLRRDPI